MKCKILHESAGRMRVHLNCRRMTLHQADVLEYYLRNVDGVREVSVFDRTQDAVIVYRADRAALVHALAAFSFDKSETMDLVPDHTTRKLNREFEDKLSWTVIRRVISKLFFPLPVTTALAIYHSIKYIREGLSALLHGKLSVAVLDATAVTVSMVRGDFDTAGSVMFLLRLGELLEEWTRKKSLGDLARCMSLNVDRVWQQTAEGEVLVPISQVCAGDAIVVHTGSVIPLDGRVLDGEASVNQASLTGEAEPVRKSEGAVVYAGTVVEEGQITVTVEQQAGNGRYDQIVKMIENSEKLKSASETRAAALEQIVAYGREAAAKETDALVNRGAALLACAEADAGEDASWQSHLDAGRRQLSDLNAKYEAAKNAEAEARRAYLAAHGAAGDSGAGRALDALTEELARKKSALDAAARTRNSLEATADTITGLLTQLNRSGFAVEKELWPQRLTAEHLPALTEELACIEKPLEEQYFAARQASADLAKEQEALRAELNAVSGGKWVYPHGDAATKVRDAVNAELKSRGMTADAKIFCELLTVADESWQDCVEACLGDRRFDILVPPAHYAAAKSAFVALRDKVGPISLLDTPSIRTANRKADAAPADSLAAQVRSENPLAAQYADTILRRIVCCDTPDTLENYPDSATRDLLRHHPFRLERLRTPQRYIGLDARRARAEALTKALDELTARSKEAAQSAAALKAARDSYQDVLHSSVMDELAALWDARAALEAARADCTAQEQKLAECRENPMLQQLYKEDEAREAAHAIGYPVLVRPSYVLGGRGMEIVYDDAQLRKYVDRALKEAQADTVVSGRLPSPLLIDKFLQDAVEIDVDALFDGEELYIGGIMEHVEEAGVHSGDAACTLPPSTLSDDQIRRLREGTYAIAKGCGVQGLINVQYAFMANTLYVIEANPRASRTVPFASKATGVALAKAAARIMVGETIQQQRGNKKILDEVRKVTLNQDLISVLKNLDQDLVKGAVAGEKFQELFFANCKDEKIAEYVKTLLA